MRRLLVITLPILAVGLMFSSLLVSGVLAAPRPASTPTKTVKIIQMKNGKYAFSPADIAVKKGTKVIWKNTTGTDHTVTVSNSKLGISDIPPGSKASITFAKTGVYKYHCSFHPYMKGQVTVKK